MTMRTGVMLVLPARPRRAVRVRRARTRAEPASSVEQEHQQGGHAHDDDHAQDRGREPATDRRADHATDDGADGDQPGDGQSTSATAMNTTAAMPFTSRARTFLVALSRWRVSATPMPEDRHQQHPLGGTEVAAVHTGAEDAGPHPPGATVLGAAHRAPRRASATQLGDPRPEDDQEHAEPISTGTIASNASVGSTRRSTAPADRRSGRRRRPDHPRRAVPRARGGSRSTRTSDPGTSPMVLETLAVTGGTPNASRVGNVIRVPDPTTVLMVPAATPASRIAAISRHPPLRRAAPPGRGASCGRCGAAATRPGRRPGSRPACLRDGFLDRLVGPAQLGVGARTHRQLARSCCPCRPAYAAPRPPWGCPPARSSWSRGPPAPCRSRWA